MEDDEFDGSDDGSISLDDEDLFEESDVDDSDGSGDDSDGGPKAKKHKPLSSKEFNRKLKHSDGENGLYICGLQLNDASIQLNSVYFQI